MEIYIQNNVDPQQLARSTCFKNGAPLIVRGINQFVFIIFCWTVLIVQYSSDKFKDIEETKTKSTMRHYKLDIFVDLSNVFIKLNTPPRP